MQQDPENSLQQQKEKQQNLDFLNKVNHTLNTYKFSSPEEHFKYRYDTFHNHFNEIRNFSLAIFQSQHWSPEEILLSINTIFRTLEFQSINESNSWFENYGQNLNVYYMRTMIRLSEILKFLQKIDFLLTEEEYFDFPSPENTLLHHFEKPTFIQKTLQNPSFSQTVKHANILEYHSTFSQLQDQLLYISEKIDLNHLISTINSRIDPVKQTKILLFSWNFLIHKQKYSPLDNLEDEEDLLSSIIQILSYENSEKIIRETPNLLSKIQLLKHLFIPYHLRNYQKVIDLLAQYSSTDSLIEFQQKNVFFLLKNKKFHQLQLHPDQQFHEKLQKPEEKQQILTIFTQNTEKCIEFLEKKQIIQAWQYCLNSIVLLDKQIPLPFVLLIDILCPLFLHSFSITEYIRFFGQILKEITQNRKSEFLHKDNQSSQKILLYHAQFFLIFQDFPFIETADKNFLSQLLKNLLKSQENQHLKPIQLLFQAQFGKGVQKFSNIKKLESFYQTNPSQNNKIYLFASYKFSLEQLQNERKSLEIFEKIEELEHQEPENVVWKCLKLLSFSKFPNEESQKKAYETVINQYNLETKNPRIVREYSYWCIQPEKHFYELFLQYYIRNSNQISNKISYYLHYRSFSDYFYKQVLEIDRFLNRENEVFKKFHFFYENQLLRQKQLCQITEIKGKILQKKIFRKEIAIEIQSFL